MAVSRCFRKLRLTLHAFYCITLSVLILVIMLIEAGGLNEHANVTQSPAVFYEAFIFSGSPPSLFAWFRLFYRPCILSGQNRIYTGRIGKIDTQHFLQVRFYPAEEDQVMGDQVMQL